MADSDSGPKREGYLDKGLSWDKRLELARAKRAEIEAEQGPMRPTPRLKPWESEGEDPDPAGPAVVPEYPDIPPERRAAVLARMRAAKVIPSEPAVPKEPPPPASSDSPKPKRSPPRKAKPLTVPLPLVPTPDVLDANERSSGDAVAAVNRLISLPPGADLTSRLYGARFDPIPQPETRRHRLMWLIALVCILGGLLAGVLLAVALFFAFGTEARKPSPQRALAYLTGKPAAISPEVAPTAPAQSAALAIDSDVPSIGPSDPEPRRVLAELAMVGRDIPPAYRAVLPRPRPFNAPVVSEAGPLSDTVPQVAPDEPVAREAGPAGLTLAQPGHSPDKGPTATAPVLAASAPDLAAPGSDAPAHIQPLDPAPRLAAVAPLAGAEIPDLGPLPPTPQPLLLATRSPELGADPLEGADRIVLAALETAPIRSTPTRPVLPATADRRFACAACTLTGAMAKGRTIRLRLPGALARSERGKLKAMFGDAGFDRVLPSLEALPVQSSQVRYFHPEDADAARLLAELTRAELFDLSWFSPLPPGGTIEVLIASGGLSGAFPPG